MTNSVLTLSSGEVSTYYATRFPQLKQQRAAEWRGPCPLHHGKDNNFAVEAATGEAFCHSQCGRGWDILALEQASTGADFKTAKAEVFRIIGRADSPNDNHSARAPIEATYDYLDEVGQVLYQTIRMLPKDFRQRRPDGKGGWTWNLNGVRLVLYHLPELLKRETGTAFLCEGEKDVHCLEAWGLLATCNAMGAGKWRTEYSETLRGRAVVILPDNDIPGRKHAAAVAAALLEVSASVRIVELPSLPEKGDVTDWCVAVGTVERLWELSAAAVRLDAAGLFELRARWGLADEPNHRAANAVAGSLVTRRLSDINAKPVSWLWPGRIARGKVSIIAGNPGLGKSQITASIAAIVTAAGRWPVDRSQCKPGEVLFLSAEDDPADTLRPRLEAAGANLDRVHVMVSVIVGYTGEGQQQNRAFSLQRDVEALSVKLTELGDVAAVVIDPITAYLGDVDSHRNAEVRALLAPLSELAAKHDTAIIGVSHLNKSAGPEALMRVTGSLAFVAAARAAYLVAQDPDNPGRRFFLPMKNNIGPDSAGLAFRIEAATVQSTAGPLESSLIVWEPEPVTTTADEVMRPQAPEHGSALREAEEWLQDALTEPTSAAEISRSAEEVGISKKTLRRASQSLRIGKEKTGMKAGWVWSLPPKMTNASEDDQRVRRCPTKLHGHLRQSEVAMVEVEL